MLVEAFIIMMFTVDYLFKVIFRYQSGKRTRFRAAFCEASFITNTICILAFIIDATVFFAVYPTPYFRFSRLFRPIKLWIESKSVSKTLRAIGKTVPQIIDVMVLMTLIMCFYALLGNRILPHDIDGVTVNIYEPNLSLNIAWEWLQQLSIRMPVNIFLSNAVKLPRLYNPILWLKPTISILFLPIPDFKRVHNPADTRSSRFWSF